jgi:PhzF family phenazine biosynthesis protein
MQAVAAEMNLSETAFLVRREDRLGFDLRWFTPAVEVALCGHATLASARVLWEEGHAPADQAIAFHTKSGELRATVEGEWISLDFPATPPTEAAPPAGLAAALGVEPRWVGRSRFDYMVLVDDAATVRDARPDIGKLAQVEARGVMLTARGDEGSGHDIVSRFFAPAAGVAEDPVTGSAHCCLAPFWAERLGRDELVAYQASRRGGVLRLRVRGERVELGGRTTVVARGELLCTPD